MLGEGRRSTAECLGCCLFRIASASLRFGGDAQGAVPTGSWLLGLHRIVEDYLAALLYRDDFVDGGIAAGRDVNYVIAGI